METQLCQDKDIRKSRTIMSCRTPFGSNTLAWTPFSSRQTKEAPRPFGRGASFRRKAGFEPEGTWRHAGGMPQPEAACSAEQVESCTLRQISTVILIQSHGALLISKSLEIPTSSRLFAIMCSPAEIIPAGFFVILWLSSRCATS